MNTELRRILVALIAAVTVVYGLILVAQSGPFVLRRGPSPSSQIIPDEIEDPSESGDKRLVPSANVESLALTALAAVEIERPRKADLDLRGMLQGFDDRTMASWMAFVTFAPDWTRISLLANCNEPCDEYGNRLVHIASRSGNHAALWVLMQNGANPEVMNQRNETSLQIVRSSDRTKRDFMILCLLQHRPERIPETLAWFHAEDEQRIPARIGVFADEDPAPTTSWLPVFGRISLPRK